METWFTTDFQVRIDTDCDWTFASELIVRTIRVCWFTEGESNKRGESKRHVSYNEVVVSLGIKIVTIAFHRTTIKISFQAKTWNAREIEMLTIKIEKTSAYFIYIFVITLSYLSPTMSSWLIKAMYPEWNSMLHLPNLLRVTLVQRSLLLDVLASNYG